MEIARYQNNMNIIFLIALKNIKYIQCFVSVPDTNL